MSEKSARSTYILLVSFLLLIVFVILFELPSRKAMEGAGKVPFYNSFSLENIGAILVYGADQATITDILYLDDELKVRNGSESFAIEPEILTSFSEAFENAPEATRVSTNPERYPTYGLEGENTLHLEMKNRAGEGYVDVFLGKAGPVVGTEYVRMNGRDEVLLINANLRDTFVKSVDAFRLKDLFSFENNDQVAKVFLESEKGVFEFEKQADGWHLVGSDEKLNQDVLETTVGKIRNLEAKYFVYEQPENSGVSADKPAYGRIVVSLKNGQKQELWVGNPISENAVERYVMAKESSDLGVLDQSTLDEIFNSEWRMQE